MANILLINLLIASFNTIYNSVNARSLQFWNFQRFSVVSKWLQFTFYLRIINKVYFFVLKCFLGSWIWRKTNASRSFHGADSFPQNLQIHLQKMPGKKYPFWIWFEVIFEQVWFGAIVWFWRGMCWRHAEGKWVGVSKENWCPGQKCSSKLKVA